MAHITYTEGGVEPVSRVREEIPDTVAADATFKDRTLERWIEDGLSDERVLIYLPTGTDGATAATVQVSLVGAGEDAILRLSLARTISGEVADTLQLAPGRGRPKIEDAIDWIGGLDKGWQVGFRIGRDVEWVIPTSTNWVGGLVKTGRLPQYAPSINLALTLGATPIAAYGAREDAAELRFYQLYSAVVRALDVLDRSDANVESATEADMQIRFNVTRRLRNARHRAAMGIYSA